MQVSASRWISTTTSSFRTIKPMGRMGRSSSSGPAPQRQDRQPVSFSARPAIGFDKAGRMLVIDQAAPTLNVYHPGSSTPATQLPLPGASLYFSWAKSLKRIYVADYALGEIDVFDYIRPSSRSSTQSPMESWRRIIISA